MKKMNLFSAATVMLLSTFAMSAAAADVTGTDEVTSGNTTKLWQQIECSARPVDASGNPVPFPLNGGSALQLLKEEANGNAMLTVLAFDSNDCTGPLKGILSAEVTTTADTIVFPGKNSTLIPLSQAALDLYTNADFDGPCAIGITCKFAALPIDPTAPVIFMRIVRSEDGQTIMQSGGTELVLVK